MMLEISETSALIGDTPLIDVSRLFPESKARVLAKIEYFNPGLSVKDRIAKYILDQLEAQKRIIPGGTIIECSSGNTGIGLAILAAERGYRFICFMQTKHSKEKIRLIRALGGEVKICDGSLERSHPESAQSQAALLAEETPNSYWINQYDNPLNPEAHYHSTGPEIWNQTNGQMTHFIASASTGGTLSGCARFFREQSNQVKNLAADSYGSALAHYHETGEFDPSVTHNYKAENVGKKYIPGTLNFSVVDKFIKVTDGAAARMARNAARQMGLLLGYSCGAALEVVNLIQSDLSHQDLVVVMCPDHGSRYMNTIYNDEWMEENGFMESTKILSENGSVR